MTIDKKVKENFVLGRNYILSDIKFDLDHYNTVGQVHIYRGRGQEKDKAFFFRLHEGKFYHYDVLDDYVFKD